MKAKRRSCDIVLLIQWEFQFFKQFSIYRDEEDFSTALNSLISQQQFQLITKLMSKAKKYTSQEVIELFKLGDKFLVSGQTKEKIFSLFVKQLLLEEISIRELLYLNLWNESVNRLKWNWAIEIDKNSIKLDGLKVNPESKEESFGLLQNLAKNYKVLYIRDIPLCANDLEVIHPDLTELHIERCPFNFEEQLDLSQLTRLTHFTCSNCFADCHLLFALESFTCNLEYLDISNNWLNPIDHAPLVACIEKQKSLKTLNLTRNNLNIRSAPTLFNVLFNHPSLEILNLAKNYLAFELFNQLSSFPGSLNWKSLTINSYDKLLMDSDLFPVCFSKLKQLEYLDMSDKHFQDLTSSLCKGFSKMSNLKRFIFNSYTQPEYSKEIENAFKKNTNLELYLTYFTLRSFEDWKLPDSHYYAIGDLVKNENIKNASQLICRHINYRLELSNNKLSQIEHLINKFIGVERVKLFLIHSSHKLNYVNCKFFPPQSMEFYVSYKTENDLKNLLFCCKNYFKSTFFHYVPLKNFKGRLCRFMLETKSSLYWETIEELELTKCDIKTVLEIISEFDLPNLKCLRFEKFKTIYKAYRFAKSVIQNWSLRQLSITFDERATYDESLRVLFKCFPNMIEFKIHLECNLSNNIPISALPKGLRELDIPMDINIDCSDFLNDLATFPLLTIQNDWKRSTSLNEKKTLYLPNLIELDINQNVLNNIRFVLPELRKLTIHDIYNSALEYLKEFKKLKKLKLKCSDGSIPQKIIESNLIFSFPNLNNFFCKECRVFYGDFNYDFVSEEISKSLIWMDVYDSSGDPYYCQKKNAKLLVEKKVPFLYKYGPRIVECQPLNQK